MPQVPHILILPSWYPRYASDSAGIFFREQAIALAKAGLNVGVIAPQRVSLRILFKPRPTLLPFSSLNETLGEYIGPPRSETLDSALWRRTAQRLYRTYVARHGTPDIVHAHSLFPAGLLALHLPARGYVLTEHAGVFLTSRAPLVLDSASGALRGFARRIAVSQHLAARMEALAPDEGAWTYIPNLVDTTFFVPQPASRGGTRVLTVSNLRQSKGVDVLIRAFDQAFSRTEAELLIGGHGEDRSDLEALAASLPSRPRIRFLGPLTREQVREQMSQCSFFALASYYETFGVVLIEALAMGKPILATDCGGPVSIVRAGNGILVPPRDVTALAAGMAQMAARLHTYSSTAIRQDCVERFSEQAVSAQLCRLYNEVLTRAL
jgi:glycosyltransferase involved in cell wall biosynthesis